MSTRIIGRGREGRRVASTATGVGNVNAIAIKAPNGDTTTVNSATPFLEFTNAKIDGADKNGATNLTKYAVTTLTPGASDIEGVLCSINGVNYWIPVYKTD
tara:strand:- start:169 stop:471 length:303 start_codon:yes stop_codon:yes gene_type:complete